MKTILLKLKIGLGIKSSTVSTFAGIKLSIRHNDVFGQALLVGAHPELQVEAAVVRFVKPGMTVLDIGANIGYYSTIMASLVQENGKVIAFEPNPLCRVELDGNLQRNNLVNVTVEEIGLGEKYETRDLELPVVGMESHSSLMKNSTFRSIGSVRVLIRSLDEYVTTKSLKRLDFIKCDVEGAELLVFRGGAATIRRMRPTIVFESADELTQPFGYSMFGVLEFLVGLGYSIKQISMCNWLATPTQSPARSHQS